jgi:serralysin
LNLKKGGVYSFGAGYSNKYSGAKPTLYMTVTNSAGKVVTSSKTNTLSWTATATDDYVITFGITPAKGGTAVFTKYNIDASQSLSKLPASSGDKNVDAVLAGGAAWWHDAGNVASVSTTPISSTIKQLTGASQTVYYGFLTGNESFLAAKDQVGFKAMDDQQQTVVQSAFDYLSSLINVSFVHDETKATIEFGTNNQTSSAGYASYPQGNGANPSVLLLDNSDNPGNSGSALGVKGQYGWETLIHEIGHAMGLKHPGAYNAGGGTTAGPYLSAALDNRANSIMSYNDPLASKVLSLSASGASSYTYSTPAANPYTYQTLDIAALQYLYGANKATVASDVTLTDSYKNFQTIWAPQAGGVGLNAASTTRTNLFDLREGGYSSVSMRLTDGDFTSELKDGFLGIGYSATNAAAAANRLYTSLKTTKNSSKQLLSTTLYNGKNNVALSYGSKYSTVTGGKSSDKFYASNYSATLDGGDGTDTVYLQGSAKDWVIDANKTTATSKVGSVTIGLRNIESIAFYKSTEALIHA